MPLQVDGAERSENRQSGHRSSVPEQIYQHEPGRSSSTKGADMAETRTVDKLAGFVAELSLDEVPHRVIEKARLQQASAFAAAFGSRLDAGARKVIRAVRDRRVAGKTRIFATGEAAALHEAVVANAASTCAFDWDDILLVGHPSHSAVSVSCCLGEVRGDVLGDVLLAQIVANEIGGRFGLACFLGPQNGQNLPFLHHIGAAAAAAKLMKLDREATSHALSIALAQPQMALWPAFLGPIESKVLTAAHPAEIGLSAAEQARAGLLGPLDLLDHERGFFSQFAYLPMRRALGGLGETWLTDTLQVKLHAACWYFQAALDAASTILADLGRTVDPTEIRRVRCRTNMLASSVHQLAVAKGGDRISPNTMNFRLDFSLALFLLVGRLSPVELECGRLLAREEEILKLAAKTEIDLDVALSRRMVQTLGGALDLPALFADGGIWKLLRALRWARREFRGVRGPGFGNLLRLLPVALRGAVAIIAARKRPFEMGQAAASMDRLALECGTVLEIELMDGRVFSAEAAVPAGCLRDLGQARERVLQKLRQGVEIAGGTSRDADGAVATVMDSPMETPIARLLHQLSPKFFS